MILDVTFEEQTTEIAADFGHKVELNYLIAQSVAVKKSYAISNSSTDAPTEWEDESPTPTTDKPYLWMKTETSYTTVDGTVYNFADNGIVIGGMGAKGEPGEKGDPGEKGEPGATPVKGTDYFTPAEVDGIADQAAGKVTLEGIGAAPAGYGLGGNAKYVEVNSLDELTANGWYAVRLLTPIIIDSFSVEHCYCEVSNYNVVIGTQKITPLGSGLVIRRFFDTAGFWPWEWENPYLAPGVEYRTTERWNGKVVYTRLVDCLGAVDGAWVNLDTTYTTMIRYAGIFNNADTLPIENTGNYARIQVFSGYAVISQKGYDGINIKVQLWYTKD